MAKPLSSIHARCDNGTGDGAVGAISRGSSLQPKVVQISCKGDGLPNKGRPRKRIWDPLYQAGRDNVSLPKSGRRPPTLVGDTAPDQTSQSRKPVEVQRKSDYNNKSAGHTASIRSTSRSLTPDIVQECFKQVPYLKRHSLICTRRCSQLAKGQDLAIPLFFFFYLFYKNTFFKKLQHEIFFICVYRKPFYT